MEYIGEKELKSKLLDFKNHLEHADRMILSAKFGDGKSFFLQKIREDVDTFKKYEFITLYPVNYVVAPNEDIFEYIKRDILVQLVRLGLLNKLDLNKLITSVFSFESFKEVISFLISCIPGGAFYTKILDRALDISQKYNDEKATYDKYFKSFKVQKGGLYEEDAYTKIIIEALSLLKNGYIDDKNGLVQKKPVLIVEDLDRLDPAHLFRILNVISAHIEDAMQPDKVGNKFGFCNIVIIMDYDTTRHIFEHFYGRNASYEGYMSKFIVEEPFRYSLTDLALSDLKEKIAIEVGISKELLNQFVILNKKLSGFSIRDIKRVYDLEILNRIRNPQIVVSDDFVFSTNLPIFKLIIYMIEIGMSEGDMNKDIVLQDDYNKIEYLKLIYPLYCVINRRNDPQSDFIESQQGVRVILKKENNVITDIQTKCYGSYNLKSPSITSVSKGYATIFHLFSTCIDMSCFNRNSGYTVDYLPNYKLQG